MRTSFKERPTWVGHPNTLRGICCYVIVPRPGGPAFMVVETSGQRFKELDYLPNGETRPIYGADTRAVKLRGCSVERPSYCSLERMKVEVQIHPYKGSLDEDLKQGYGIEGQKPLSGLDVWVTSKEPVEFKVKRRR